MINKLYAEITFESEKKNLNDILFLNGLFKSDQHFIGDISVRGIKLDYSQISYITDIIETHDTNDIAEILYNCLNRDINPIIEYVRDNECKVSICIVIHEQGDILPSLCLGRNIICIASKLNAEISFDGI